MEKIKLLTLRQIKGGNRDNQVIDDRTYLHDRIIGVALERERILLCCWQQMNGNLF